MNTQFRRILDLVRRTGDRMVVTDPEGTDVFVVMGIDQYETLLGLTDATAHPSAPSGSSVPPGSFDAPDNIWDVMQPAGEEGQTWDMEQMSEGERAELKRQFDVFQNGLEGDPNPSVPVSSKEDEGPVEEQFYLEPIE